MDRGPDLTGKPRRKRTSLLSIAADAVNEKKSAGDGEGLGVRNIVIPQDDVDELHIIERWLHHHANEPGQFPLPDDREAASGWWSLAENLVAFDPIAEDWTRADLDTALSEEDEDVEIAVSTR